MKPIVTIGKVILIFLLTLTLISCSTAPVSRTVAEPSKETVDLFMEAVKLIDSVKYEDARKLLEDNYDIIKDYDIGLNIYGSMEFHIFKNYEKAEELLKRAIRINPQNPSHYVGMAYLYEAKGQCNKAIQYFENAAKHIISYDDVPINSELATVYKDIGECYLNLNDEKRALEYLEKAFESNPFGISTNAILHKLYVEAERYDKAYEVWKKDNLIDDSGKHVYKGMIEWDRLYYAAIENKNHMTHYQWANIYENLILYDEAAAEYRKALAQDQTNEEIRNRLYEVECYLSFRDDLQAILDDYYRQRCIKGPSEETTFYNRIKPAYEKIAPLFPHHGTGSGITSRWIENLNDEIEERFNVRIENIKANGNMLGLHFGRIVDSSNIHSSLWGHETDLNVITMKNMVSNGLDYWRTLESGGVGGWSISRTEIVRVIQDNENDNKLRLCSLYNKDAKEDYIKRLGIIKANETEKKPLELYYSMDNQMRFIDKQIDAEVEKARGIGITESSMQSYLFDKMEKEFYVITSISIHESQHSIDNILGLGSNWIGEGEYRAKLSQLAYGYMPFFTLNQCYDTSIGVENNNTHTMANTRLFKDIVHHIYDNHYMYPQIDISKNILSQLTKLSEDELRNIGIKVFEKYYPDEKYM